MASPEIGLQEVPKPPSDVVRRLKDYDPRLELEFSVPYRVWEVKERLPSGALSHVCFWHDGPWNNMTFRPLGGAEPLLAKITSIDWAKSHMTYRKKAAELRAQGAGERAFRLEQAKTVGARKFLAMKKWYRKNAEKLMRQMAMGGSAASDAAEFYRDAKRDNFGA